MSAQEKQLPHMCQMHHPMVRFDDPAERFSEPYNCPWCEVVRLENLIVDWWVCQRGKPESRLIEEAHSIIRWNKERKR